MAATARSMPRLVALGLGEAVTLTLRSGRRHPRIAAALLAVCALVVLGWLAVRHTSLSGVRQVDIVGVHGAEAGRIETALTAAARRQSTLGVDTGALTSAVQRFGVVRSVHATASFPHRMRIVVSERLPVATLTDGTRRAVVAGDGTVLPARVRSDGTPTIPVPALPSGRVVDTQLLAELRLLDAAPPVLLHRVQRIFSGPKGLTADMRNGLLIFFGDDALPHAKWLSAAAVIVSPLAAGATYVDVRSPGHPAAGGLPSSQTSAVTTGTDPNEASLAQQLQDALNSP